MSETKVSSVREFFGQWSAIVKAWQQKTVNTVVVSGVPSREESIKFIVDRVEEPTLRVFFSRKEVEFPYRVINAYDENQRYLKTCNWTLRDYGFEVAIPKQAAYLEVKAHDEKTVKFIDVEN